MRLSVFRVSLLLFGSGFCALVYQVTWLRLLRLIFGSSTAASAAVLAIFMAGLGFGSLLLGRRADRKASPLGFYATLEFGIALAAAASPLLVLLARGLYIALGGTQVLGPAPGTLLRVVLAAAVLGLPTFLMGGTLPAVARAVERGSDLGRRYVGLLYAFNTLGAVLGALATTLFSLEVLGIRRTIWVAALINLLVAVLARKMAREAMERESAAAGPSAAGLPAPAAERPAEPVAPAAAPVPFVLAAAAIVGFAFFLMELVWYRMLAPLLGGSSYTFGLILAVALLGIGLGGLLYGAGAQRRRPTLIAFAATCSLEALFMILPFALGDRLAVLAWTLRDLSAMGFAGLAGSWVLVTLVVVLLPSLVAGYQFPLLVAVLGSGRREVGRQVGLTYAWNTVGAIAGSFAGGFGLIPLLSAPGAWRFVVVLLILQAAVALALSWPAAGGAARRRFVRVAAAPAATAALALLLCYQQGPTAFWRHSPIGAGRMHEPAGDPIQLKDLIHRRMRTLLWEADGRESSVAVRMGQDGYSFLINGKSDGSSRADAPTQVMSGLVGAALHPAPRRAMVIGLGTGSTAGWLAEVPTMERVDVVELEPEILRVAEDCRPVNHDVLRHPKTRVMIGDGREVLLTSPERYDLIFSEPSNPYRAGIASLFTRDFYRAVAGRLEEGGIFIQWLQGYEVDAQVVRTAYATLSSVFPSVESWQVHHSDLLLLAGARPIRHDPGELARRLAGEPYRSALNWAWGVEGPEGLYAAFIANGSLARAMLEEESRWINTDDRPIIEFGFARNVGRQGLFEIAALRRLARARGDHRPAGLGEGGLDWERVEEMRQAAAIAYGVGVPGAELRRPDQRRRLAARRSWVRGNLAAACASWFAQQQGPRAPLDVVMVADCLADAGDERAEAYVERLAADLRPVDALAVEALWHERRGDPRAAAESLLAAFDAARRHPWFHPPVFHRALQAATRLSRADAETGKALFHGLAEPFSLRQFEELRLTSALEIARTADFDGLCLEALAPFEPWVPWSESLLGDRLRCYSRHQHPLALRARYDLERFLAASPFKLEKGLLPATPAASSD